MELRSSGHEQLPGLYISASVWENLISSKQEAVGQLQHQLPSQPHGRDSGLYLQFMELPVLPEVELQLLPHCHTHPQHLLAGLGVLGRNTQADEHAVTPWHSGKQTGNLDLNLNLQILKPHCQCWVEEGQSVHT